MNYSYFFVIGLLVTLQFSMYAQSASRCSSDEKMDEYFLANPELKIEYQKYSNDPIQAHENVSRMSTTTIPVHVIIVHPPGQSVGSGANLSFNHVMSQIDVLNEDFRRLNSDASNTPAVFSAADSEIEFCLATVDPDGLTTDGITRYATNQNFDNNESSIKSATGWDRNTYLNIWVTQTISALGYAYLPSTGSLPNAVLDGVVVLTETFGGPGFASLNPYNLGRTTTHEVGHYLGLRHVWGNGGCGNDDNIADTPTQSGSNFGCPNHPSPSCGNGGDMFMNYMDYVNDNCMNAFTQDQADYMNLILSTSRSSLQSAAGFACGSGADPLSLTLVDTEDISCFNAFDGQIEVDADGGSTPYTYTIFPSGQSNSNGLFQNLSGGTYTIEVEDDDGNIEDIETSIDEPSEIFPAITITSEISCHDGTNGEIFITATGGSGSGYSFEVPNQSPTNNSTIGNLETGFSMVTITDGSNCSVTAEIFFDNPPEMSLAIITQTNPSCYQGNDGIIEIEANGGNGNTYTYAIDGGNFGSNPTFFNLTEGSFLIEAQDTEGCTTSSTITLSDPEELVVEIASADALSCFDSGDGYLDISYSGGTGSISTSLLYNGVTTQGTEFSNLVSDTYVIMAEDANGCQDSEEYFLSQPEPLVLSSQDIIPPTCYGESTATLILDAQGGNSNYTYELNDIQYSTGIINDLYAGEFLVSVIDQNGCSDISSFIIENPVENSISVINVMDVDCSGEDNGAISVQHLNEQGSSTYMINEMSNTTGVFTDLAEGTYTVQSMDAEGCSASLDVIVNSTETIEIEFSEINNVSCNAASDGSITINANGTTSPLQYSIDGVNFVDNSTFEDLSAGNYSGYIRDNEGCTVSKPFEIIQPEILTLQLVETQDVLCNGDNSGAISIMIVGGTGNVDLLVNGDMSDLSSLQALSAGQYMIEVIDDNGCNDSRMVTISEPSDITLEMSESSNSSCSEATGSIMISASGGNGQLTYTLGSEQNQSGEFNQLASGAYDVIVTDESSCSNIFNVTVDQFADIALNIDQVANESCVGLGDGAIQFYTDGGTGDLTYFLNGEVINNQNQENLAPGQYTIEVTDEEGCNDSATITIDAAITLNLSIAMSTNATCFMSNDGMVIVEAEGGSGNYSYTANGLENTSGMFDGLESGNTEVIVTDMNGCTATTMVSISQPNQLILNESESVSPLCLNGSDGSVSLSVEGGTGQYTYAINDQTSMESTIMNLSSGTYDLTITDQNNCSIIETIIVDEGPEIILEEVNSIAPGCNGGNDAELIVSASNGLAPYTFTLNSETNSSGQFTNLSAGDYEVDVEDSNGCTTSQFFTIEDTQPIQVNSQASNDPRCFGGNDGEIEITAIGGTGEYTYTIEDETNQTGTFNSLSAGVYNIVIEDQNGCDQTLSIQLNEPEALTSADVVVSNPLCAGDSNGVINLGALGGNGQYSFMIDDIQNDNGIFENLEAGDYTYIITDSNDCSIIESLTLSNPEAMAIESFATESTTCYDSSDGSVTMNVTGGTGAIEYSIEGNNNPVGIFGDLEPTEYTLLAEDENGCMLESTFVISSPTIIDTSSVSIQPIDINTLGIINVEALGGTAPYSYSIDGINFQFESLFSELEGGMYTLFIQDDNACISEFIFEISSDKVVIGEPEGVTIDEGIYPNPVTDILTISFGSSSEQIITFTTFDAEGRYIESITEDFGSFYYDYTINMVDYAAGVYILSIASENIISYHKIVKID